LKTQKAKLKLISILVLAMLAGILIFPVGVFAASAEDNKPPTLTATLSGNTLHIEASDEGSGISAVYVDGHRINALAGGMADVNLKDYAGNAKQTEVYAVDGAGNKSKTVSFANPYYKSPVPLEAPQASQGTASSNTAASPTQSAATQNTPAPAANTGTGGSGNNEGANTSTDSAVSESAVPSGGAFTPDGSGTTLDNATDADGKEFFTVEAADGSVFYLVIDRQRGAENVYFLNAVTTNDLLALAEDGEGETAGFIEPEPIEEQKPPEDEEDTTKEKEPAEKKDSPGTYVFIILAVIAVAGAGYYLKIYRPKKEASLIDTDDYEYEDEAEYYADFSYEDELYPAAYEDEYLTGDMGDEAEDNETEQSDEEKEDTY
jgi:flagellar basal body-associated protein FliL